MNLHKQNFLDSVTARSKRRVNYLSVGAVLLFLVISASTYGGLNFAQEHYFQGKAAKIASIPDGRVLGEAVQDLGNLYSMAWLGAKAAPYVDFLNRVLGDEKSVKTYLILFQNNSEIRPSGGFLGSFARVKIVAGQVKEVEIPGEGFYGLEGSRLVSSLAPKPLTVFSPFLQIWNSNVFADFPASAQMVSHMYEKSGGDTIDGVISVSPVLLQELLALTGPIEIPEVKKTVTSENAYRVLQEHVEFEYDKKKNQPKEILSYLAPKLLEKLLSLDPSQYISVAKLISEELSKKQILFYFVDQDLQSFVVERGWGGNMLEYRTDEVGAQARASDSDYVMIVHMNVGGGKTDYAVKTQESVDVQLLPTGGVRTTVTITRTHTGDPEDKLTGIPNIDFVRVYGPAGSKLIEAEGFGGLEPETFKLVDPSLTPNEFIAEIEHDPFIVEKSQTRVVRETYRQPSREYVSFGNWIIVAPGETTTAKLTYEVSGVGVQPREPSIAAFVKKLFFQKTSNEYSLIWQKQPGMDAVLQHTRIIAPKDYEVFASSPTPDIRNQNELIWKTVSDRDHRFAIGVQ